MTKDQALELNINSAATVRDGDAEVIAVMCGQPGGKLEGEDGRGLARNASWSGVQQDFDSVEPFCFLVANAFSLGFESVVTGVTLRGNVWRREGLSKPGVAVTQE